MFTLLLSLQLGQFTLNCFQKELGQNFNLNWTVLLKKSWSVSSKNNSHIKNIVLRTKSNFEICEFHNDQNGSNFNFSNVNDS